MRACLSALGYGLSQHWNYQTVSVTKGALPSLLEVLSILTADTTVLKPAALASPVNLLELQSHWSYLRPTDSVNSNKIPKSSVCTLCLGNIALHEYPEESVPMPVKISRNNFLCATHRKALRHTLESRPSELPAALHLATTLHHWFGLHINAFFQLFSGLAFLPGSRPLLGNITWYLA